MMDADGKMTYADGTPTPEFDNLQERTCRERDGTRQAVDETGRDAALRPHPLQCL